MSLPSQRTRPSLPRLRSTRNLLVCGLLAAPLFTLVCTVQVRARDGFDLARHPLSLLSLGDAGWVQVLNFVVTGLLSIAFAVGLRRTLPPGRTAAWAAWLYGGFGAGMVLGGIFRTDPVADFPEPASALADRSWHALVHDIAAGVAIDLAIAAILVVAWRLHRGGRAAAATYSALIGLVGLVLSWWPDQDGISVRLAVAVVLILSWAAALAGGQLMARRLAPAR